MIVNANNDDIKLILRAGQFNNMSDLQSKFINGSNDLSTIHTIRYFNKTKQKQKETLSIFSIKKERKK